MTKYKAKFIVLEGIDGTGKTTTARQLKQYYESQGKSVKIYYEPYQFASFNVKDIIKNLESEKVKLDQYTILNLMIASRSISIKNILVPDLKWYDVVICDRYHYSTYAYQWKVLEALTDIFDYQDITDYYPVPDKILYFRINDLDNYANNESDKFETQDKETFKSIQDEYDSMFHYGDDPNFHTKQVTIIEVDQSNQPFFDFNQVLKVLEDL